MWVSRAELRRLLKENAALKEELREERQRAREREDHLLNQVLLATGRRVIPETRKPDTEPRKIELPITAVDEARLIALREAAVRAGKHPSEGDRVWNQMRNGKAVTVGMPDEPYVLPQ